MSYNSPRSRLFVTAALALVVTVPVLAGCSNAGGSGDGGDEFVVGFLLPENQVTRWESFDRPTFESVLAKECDNCRVIYANGAGDQTKQQSQAESMMAQGADLLVLTPVDAEGSASIVNAAKSRNIPVLGYTRLPSGPISGNVGDDLLSLGSSNGQALLDAITERGLLNKGSIVAINGDTGVAEVHEMVKGWKSVLEPAVEIGREFFTPGWDPATAQTEMDQAITALGGENIIGVMAMNDGMASGAIAAMKAAGIDPLPPVTGMDAEVAALQRILVGEQVASVYNSPIVGATRAAGVVAEWAKTGKAPEGDSTIKNSDGEEVPFYATGDLPVITIGNIQTEIIDKDIQSYDDICTADFKAACDAAGLKPAT